MLILLAHNIFNAAYTTWRMCHMCVDQHIQSNDTCNMSQTWGVKNVFLLKCEYFPTVVYAAVGVKLF